VLQDHQTLDLGEARKGRAEGHHFDHDAPEISLV
jgi:hypothetical protein